MNMYEGSDVLLNERGVEAVNKGTVRAKTATVLPQNHHLNTSQLNSQKDEELTFVANGNRSQAKEEEGEKIHSVHLREQRKKKGGGERGNRVG